jgi:hypothetical protein
MTTVFKQTCIWLLFVMLFAKLVSADAGPVAPITGAAGQNQGELYWVTFSGDCSCDGIFIMQIDSTGKVTVPPKSVLSIAEFGPGASALSKNGASKLTLWHWKFSTFLMRATINKSNLATTSKKLMSIYSGENDFLQVTQRAQNNMLLAELPSGVLKAIPVSPNGSLSGLTQSVSPSINSESDEASISADGLAIVTNRGKDDPNQPGKDKLYLQLVDEKGVSKGAPTYLATYKDIESVDVTSALDQGKRFVVYVVDTGTSPDDKLMLQVVNETGKKVGGKVTINVPPNRDEDAQTISIDPLGRFVLFTMDGRDYGCQYDDILMYQGLTPDGKKQGAPRPLVGCNFTSNDIKNLDVLQE